MKYLSYLFFVAGILVAITGAAKLPTEVGQYPDTWPVFAGGAVMAILGVILWRADIRRQQAEESAGEETTAAGNPVTFLAEIIGPARLLQEEITQLGPQELLQRVNELLEGYVLPFAEVRQKIIDHFGMARGAEILITVAFGERMLNRVWSASADGHLPEARACYPEALEAFEEAQRLVEAT